jgi:hypothetical protein
LTHGNPIGSSAMLGHLRMDYSSYSGIARPGKGLAPFIGQINFNPGDQNAHLIFLAPEPNLMDRALLALLDHLSWESGGRGALRLMAEINEDASIFEMLRLSGFNVYGRQQVWRFVDLPHNGEKNQLWRSFQQIDQHNLINLYHAVVPPLVQGSEAMDKRPVQGYVYYMDSELLAFVEVTNGPKGIFLTPVMHPNIREPEKLLKDLLRLMNSSNGRPLYLAIRDYQSWLNSATESLGGTPGNRKIMLVKHLIHKQRVSVPATIRKVLEAHGTETTSPIVHNSTKNKNETSNDIIASNK